MKTLLATFILINTFSLLHAQSLTREFKIKPNKIETSYKGELKTTESAMDKGLYKVPSRRAIPYYFYKPEEDEKLPLVVFLHGGPDGTNDNINLKPFVHKQPLIFIQPSLQRRHPCYFLAPQIKKNESWGTRNVNQPSEALEDLVSLIQDLIKKNEIDANRVYITGLSSGGWGAFDAVRLYPSVFAAGLVVSSAPATPLVEKSSQINPVWFSCNENDASIYETNKKNLEALKTKKVPSMLCVAISRKGHSAWEWAFFYKKTYQWLFKQELKK